MNEKTFSKVMELIKLAFYLISVLCGIFIGFHLSAVHYQNELLQKESLILDLYLEMEDYDNAGLSCYKIQNYVNFIAEYGIAFFDIGIDIDSLNKKCKGVRYKLLNPEKEFSVDITEIPQFE